MAEAQYLGYYFALSFAGGSCSLCGLFEPEHGGQWMASGGRSFYRCDVLLNKPCKQYHRVVPAMEGSGFDVYAIAKQVGWPIHVLLEGTDAEKTPCAMWVGLALVI